MFDAFRYVLCINLIQGKVLSRAANPNTVHDETSSHTFVDAWHALWAFSICDLFGPEYINYDNELSKHGLRTARHDDPVRVGKSRSCVLRGRPG